MPTKNSQNAELMDFLSISDAGKIQIKDGRFLAELSDFYPEYLAEMRLTD